MTGEENYIEHALHVGEELTGLSLEQLGFEPQLEDLTQDQRNRLEADDLKWAGSITPERRDWRSAAFLTRSKSSRTCIASI